jgi:hypothetical protein
MAAVRTRTAQVVALGILIVFALAVRLYGLSELEFWYDEIALWLYSVSGVPPTPLEPPLMAWVLLAAMWGLNTTGPLLIHLLPTVLMVLTIPLMLVAGKLADGRESTGWIAAILLAISPMSIYYAREGRPYALFWLISLTLYVVFLWAYRRNTLATWSAYAGLLALCGLTHLLTVQIVVAFSAFAFAYALTLDRSPERRSRLVRFMIFTAAGTIVGLSWAAARALSSSGSAIAMGRSISGAYPYGPGRYLRTILVNFGPGPIQAIDGDFTRADALAGVYVVLFLFGLWRLYATDRKALLLFAGFMFPVPLILTYANVGKAADFDWSRYVSHVFLPFLIVCSVGCQAVASLLKTRSQRAAVLALFVAAMLPSTLQVPQRDEYRQYREMSSYLERHADRLTGVIVLPYNHNIGTADERIMNIYYQQKREKLPVYALTSRTIQQVQLVPGRVGRFARPDAVPVDALPSGHYALLWKRPVDGCRGVQDWVDVLEVTGTHPQAVPSAGVTVCDLEFAR